MDEAHAERITRKADYVIGHTAKQRWTPVTDGRHEIGTVKTTDWRPDLLIKELGYDATTALSDQHFDKIMTRRLQHARHRDGLHQVATPFTLDYKQYSHG